MTTTTHENAHLILGSGSSEKGADALGSAMMRAVEQGLSATGASLNTATYTNKNGGSTASNLADFKADVKSGVKVDYRLLSSKEQNFINQKASEYAKQKGISEERANKLLTDAATIYNDAKSNALYDKSVNDGLNKFSQFVDGG